MQNVYADLHVHIGRAKGKPVKITASRELTLDKIIFQDAPRKGLDMIGIVDAGSLLVSAEIEEMLFTGDLQEHPQGGFTARNGVSLIAGAEVESCEGVHLIIYMPSLQSIKKFQKYISTRVKNRILSTQKARVSVEELIDVSFLLEGIFCPAHVFTPHKGVYGIWTDTLYSKLGRNTSQITTIELGLSADTSMADTIAETRNFTFLSNSDAHSSANIGREYNLLRMQNKSFQELRLCLEKKDGRRVVANYGMDPFLGKYHRTYCPECHSTAAGELPILECKNCGNQKIIMGVYDRILVIRDYETPHHPVGRPPYNYRVPLKDLPGVGGKSMQRLMNFFPDEIYVIEKASISEIEKYMGKDFSLLINQMRNGRLNITPGGGGFYGKVRKDNNNK